MGISGNTSLIPDSIRFEKSMVINFSGFGNQFFNALKKKVHSSSFSPVTNAPASGSFCTESVAKSKPPFTCLAEDRFFLF